jgi:hypothetical protein
VNPRASPGVDHHRWVFPAPPRHFFVHIAIAQKFSMGVAVLNTVKLPAAWGMAGITHGPRVRFDKTIVLFCQKKNMSDERQRHNFGACLGARTSVRGTGLATVSSYLIPELACQAGPPSVCDFPPATRLPSVSTTHQSPNMVTAVSGRAILSLGDLTNQQKVRIPTGENRPRSPFLAVRCNQLYTPLSTCGRCIRPWR